LAEHTHDQKDFIDRELNPRLEETKAGKRRVYFVDASHFVFGTFLCNLWSHVRLWIPSASGRQRFNVLGAYDPVEHDLVSLTNTTTVNAETVCDLLQTIHQRNRDQPQIPTTLIMDNARYQRHAWVRELAEELGIELLYLPSYSPNLNLIERYWRLIKKRALYGRCYPNFHEFRCGIDQAINELHRGDKTELKSMMTLKFQTFDEISLLAA
jgi:transposase